MARIKNIILIENRLSEKIECRKSNKAVIWNEELQVYSIDINLKLSLIILA